MISLGALNFSIQSLEIIRNTMSSGYCHPSPPRGSDDTIGPTGPTGSPTAANLFSSDNKMTSKPHKKNKKHVITPIKTSLDRRIFVEKKNVVDELLLDYGGVIGIATNAGNDHVQVTECLTWL